MIVGHFSVIHVLSEDATGIPVWPADLDAADDNFVFTRKESDFDLDRDYLTNVLFHLMAVSLLQLLVESDILQTKHGRLLLKFHMNAIVP